MKDNSSKYATLAQVAKRAGVGLSTVSRVINGGQNVRADTLAQVEDAIRQLGYVPSQAARTLRGSPAHLIGLILPDLANPFFAGCAEAIQAVARLNNSLLIVTTTGPHLRAEVEAIEMLTRQRVDGLIMVPTNWESDTLRRLTDQLPIPLVTLDRPISSSRAPFIHSNDFAGATLATAHLIEHGYKRILCLGGEPTLYTTRERVRGYRVAIESAGLPVFINTSVVDDRTADRAVRDFLVRPTGRDAIFALRSGITIEVFRSVQRQKRAIPTRVGLLGFDDFPLARLMDPPISVIARNEDLLGRRASRILFDKIHDRQQPAEEGHEVVEEVNLVCRRSCGCRKLSLQPPSMMVY